MKRFSLLLSVLFCALPLTSFSKVNLASQWELTGQSEFRFAWFDVYTAELFTPNGDYNPEQPVALRLTYHRDFKAKKIINKTISEIRRQKYLTAEQLRVWEMQLNKIFPNIKQSDSLTGIKSNDGVTHFLLNDVPIGSISDPNFSRYFFNIWLGEKTSEPDLRDDLIGENKTD